MTIDLKLEQIIKMPNFFLLQKGKYRHNQYLSVHIIRNLLNQEMKRFTQNLILNFSTFKATNHNLKFVKKLQITSKILSKIKYGFSNENLSSRQIDIKISEERWKNLQNNFKALKTQFGLIIPKEISKDYPTPEIIEFTLESLRECSNKYPEYLLQELKKEESKFYRVIDGTLGNLWRAEKKQALEFISFVMHWEIHLRNEEIGEILLRSIKKMELTLFEIFELLKMMFTLSEKNLLQPSQTATTDTNKKVNITECLDHVFQKMLVICENKIIVRLQVMNPQEYEALFKIINMLRHYDIYPEIKSSAKDEQKELNFFDIIQKNLLKNLTQIPPSSLVIMAVHYANNTKEDQDERINILQRLQQRMIFNLKFFNHQQLIAILYSYLRTSMMSKQFRQQCVSRIRLIYHELSWQNKKKILSLSSNFPQHEKILIISESQSELLRGKPVITKLDDGSIKKEYDPNIYIQPDYQLVPQIYLASYQNNLLTQQLCKRIQHIILDNIYNYDHQQVIRSVWLFTVTPSIDNNLQRLHKKLQVIIQGGFQGGEYGIKDVSIIVWSLCNSGQRNQRIYKEEAVFWNNIEFYLQEKLEKLTDESETRLSDISSILWAYTFNRPLKFKTVSLITDILLQQMDSPSINLQSFQLINIITFYYSLPPKSLPLSLLNKMKQLSVQYFEQMYSEMNYLELMKCLKYLMEDERVGGRLVLRLKVWENIVQIFMVEVNNIQYQHIMGVIGLVVDSPLGRAGDKQVMELWEKLRKRKVSLQQLQSMHNQNKQ